MTVFQMLSKFVAEMDEDYLLPTWQDCIVETVQNLRQEPASQIFLDILGQLLAGGQVGKVPKPARTWWADALDDEIPDEIAALMQGEYGDRRQELVFIGVELDEAALRTKLDACLLTDVEIALAVSIWAMYDDPFPSWDGVYEGDDSTN